MVLTQAKWAQKPLDTEEKKKTATMAEILEDKTQHTRKRALEFIST